MSFFTGKAPAQGYGNIYTPHAGSMIIQVQREHGLANRTLILSKRQMKALRFVTSRRGVAILALVGVSWLWFAAHAARETIARATAESPAQERARLDSLEHSLAELQKRYDHVSHMLGGDAAPVAAAIPLPTGKPAEQATAVATPATTTAAAVAAPATAADSANR